MKARIRTWTFGATTYGSLSVTDLPGESSRTITVRAKGLDAAAKDEVESRLRDLASEFSATAGRQCGGPSMGVANPMHLGSGVPRCGCKSPTHGTGEGLGHG